jgi:hypothetical protein
MEVHHTFKPLIIDHSIKPNIRTSDEYILIFAKRINTDFPPRSVEALQARIGHLRDQMLINYTEYISQMVSLSEFTELDDSDVQRQHSRSVELWFDQAIEQLFAAQIRQFEVRTLFNPVV